MENNTIPQDEMDRLLRESFINTPDAETDKISNMLSHHVYTSHWGVVPPVEKAQHFAKKKLLFKGISLNTLVGTGVTIAGITVASVLYVGLPKNKTEAVHEDVKAQQIAPTPSPFVENATELVPIVHPAPELSFEQSEATEVEPTDEMPATDLSVSTEQHGQIAPIVPTPQKEKTAYASGSGSKPGRTPQARYRYVVIPDINAMEAAANEKRKQEMVRQVQRMDKREWVYIPMGTTHITGDAVSVQAFVMQTHEVTNLQYRTFLYDLVLNDKLREYEKASVYDSAWITKARLEPFVQDYFWNPEYDNYPVVNITYEGAKMYCDWLTRLVNYQGSLKGANRINDIRIPTVEEWIYAAKADHDTTQYAWNGIYLRNSRGLFQANFKSSREMNEYDGSDVTAPVISYQPNDWGLYNVCGNVAEMTMPAENQMNIKGGAWNLPAEKMKIGTDNLIMLENLPAPNVGFRPVFTVNSDQ